MRHACLAAVIVALGAAWPHAAAQDSAPQAVFRSGVNMVSMTAIVRDAKGRVVSTLTRNDFEVFDGGERRPLLDLRSEEAAPASVALLVDGSGSMKATAAAGAALRVSNAVLLSLNPERDDAALFSFDTRLLTIRPFTRDIAEVGRALTEVESWGSTSLYDAIAGTAGVVSARTANRRAIVVLTDGADTTSTYTPTRVAEIASAVDAPVYAVVWDSRAPESRSTDENARLGSLRGLAEMTGGELFVVGNDVVMDRAIRTILEELRHQYVLAFEAAPRGGWRAVRVQTRKRGLVVRTRAWYLAGAAD
jgi:Ca-activated chloride channel family protein